MPNASAVHIVRNSTPGLRTINLPSSKSESNRALIINCFANGKLHNLSEARDTQTMMRLLDSDATELDVLDAGTTMRFLTAYFALTGKQKILTGTPRMCERPIGILVDALKEIGAEINYLNHEGYPPLATKGFLNQQKEEISIQGDVSSQYISAIMMIAPTLPNGLRIKLKGRVASKPYIMMTLQLMRQFGSEVDYTANDEIIVKPSKYKASNFTVESDWSGASYWFSVVALAEKAEITLNGLKEDSLQGDNRIIEIMNFLGVKSVFTPEGLLLSKSEPQKFFEYDFSHCPDLGQTIAVVCAAKGVEAKLTGLESLRIKETDRILALQNELKKLGAQLEDIDGKLWKIHPSKSLQQAKDISIETYDDHRMAMAFAPLAALMDVVIKDPSAVNKSYPSFWKHMETAGFELNYIF